MNWRKQASIYRAFQAESEVAIRRYTEGYCTMTKLLHDLREADRRLADSLHSLRLTS